MTLERWRPALRIAGHLCRLLLACVFLAAGLLKGMDPEGFGVEVAQYGLLSGLAARAWAYALIPLEVAVGVALLLNYRSIMSLAAASGLMVIFIGAIGYAIVTDQPVTDCGCFGRNTPRTPQETLREDIGFLAAGIVGILGLGGGPRGGGRLPRWKGVAVAATALGSVAFVSAAPHLPLDDYATALRPGVRWEDLGIPLAEVRLHEGTHLVAILGLDEDLPAATLESLNRLAAGGAVPVIGLSSEDESVIFEFRFTRGPAFPIYHVSRTDLRRLHRRLPRFFVLHEGVVTATWPEPPSESRLATLDTGSRS